MVLAQFCFMVEGIHLSMKQAPLQINSKKRVYEFWNETTCGTQYSDKDKFTKPYFEDIENYRYSVEPQIFSFAQFTRFYGKKVLEVGIGAGTDFLQWIRAGAKAYGIDLTPEAIRHIEKRLEVYHLKAEEIKVADSESIPYEDNTFDLVYSWGVIHHTPDTRKALREIVRVIRPGGMGKIMVYHKHSLSAFYLWLRKAFFAFRPWKTFSWCLYHYQENIGTKAFTIKEIRTMLKDFPVANVQIRSHITYCDTLEYHNRMLARRMGEILSYIFSNARVGWFLTIQFEKEKA